ncbi:MAG: RICIN domain-containing protein, partial [Bryobacteraceae bacterium]
LWTFVTPDAPGICFLQNPASGLVIDIQGASTKPGTHLDAYTKKSSYPDWNNQLWTFAPSSVSEYYFIVGDGNLVIDVQGASTKAGTLLDAYTQKTSSPDWDNQLWTFIDEDGNFVPPPQQEILKFTVAYLKSLK